jgi:hypothetical protein
MKDQELEAAFNTILNFIDTRPNTRTLFHEIVGLWLEIRSEEE